MTSNAWSGKMGASQFKYRFLMLFYGKFRRGKTVHGMALITICYPIIRKKLPLMIIIMTTNTFIMGQWFHPPARLMTLIAFYGKMSPPQRITGQAVIEIFTNPGLPVKSCMAICAA